METQKIVNLLSSPNNEYSKFATKNGWQRIKQWLFAWKSNKLLTKSIESSLCDYSDAYILVTANISITRTIAAPAGSPAGTQLHKLYLKIVHHLKIAE